MDKHTMYVLKKIPQDFVVVEQASYDLKEKGPYSIWLLTKTQMNTMHAIERIADFLHLKIGNIGFAGNKDKHAITEQYISIKGACADSLKNFKHPKMCIEFIGWRSEPISLGDHRGNSFEITIRDIEQAPRRIDRMVNYFGEQRMGTRNWKIGYRLLKGELKEACDLIPDERVHAFLKENPKQYVEAIKKVPRRTMLLFIHAYQSRVWNRVVADYVRKHSREVIEHEWLHGTLVIPKAFDAALDINAPVVGFGTEFADADIKQRTLELLEEDGLTQRSFITSKLPFLAVEGSERPITAQVHGLRIGPLEDDDLHEGKKKCTVSFFLSRGCYATMAVRQMMILIMQKK